MRDKVIAVTGAGNGIGREVARVLLDRGARVAAVDIRADGLAALAADVAVGARLSTHVCDLTDRAAVAALPAAVVAAHGVVDGLVHVAGIIQPFVPLVDLDDAVIDRVLSVNLGSTIALARAFVPVLRERPVAHLANVSSMGGLFPFPGQTMYGASKAAVRLLTEGLYAELLDTNVRVSVIMPGAIATEIMKNSGVAGGPVAADDAAAKALTLTPAEAARRIVAGLEADRLHIYVGTDARVMQLMANVAPRTAIRFVQRRMKGMLPST